jgi:hypothetical protein
MKARTIQATIVVITALYSFTALADGALLGSSALAEADKARLVAWIAEARQTDSEPFDVLAQLEREMPSLDAQKRGRFVPVTRSFRSYAHRALPAIVERLVFRGGVIESWTPSAETAFLTGLVQVLGEFVDTRTEPVLHALLDAPSVTEFHLVYTTAGALGWHGTASAERHLLEAAAESHERQFGVLAGLGQLHTVSAVQRLATALQQESAPARQKWLIKSVRDAGNSGYWRWARKRGLALAEDSVRLVAMQTLVKAFTTTQDDVQLAAANGIMMVDHPETPAVLEAAVGTIGIEVDRKIEKLQRRFANPPLMRRR